MSTKTFLVGLAVIVTAAGLFFGAMALEGKKPESGRNTVNSENNGEFVVDLPKEQKIDLVIQCDEEFFQDAYKRFRKEHLGIDADPIAVPGGIKALVTSKVDLPEELKPVERAVIEALKRYPLRRVVLTAHSHCLIYDVIAAWQNEPETVRERQLSDLEIARGLIKSVFPNAEVDVYYADRDGDKLRFRQILKENKEVK